ncbi:tyrosine-type recombinase/integrase [Flavobacterium sp.]|uniref:tyrosine-type recombinase/integrase n=1 Tax=Flavobacterium sp. TaxID=239 RepID=UPI0028BD5C32|nr:tyrosine-type recombinase/integrase [Flavobacterium sp.]
MKKKTIQTPAFQNLLNEFESYVKVKNYKQGKGSTMYQSAVREFLIWLEESGITKIKQVTGKESVNYLEYLITRPNQRRTGTLADKTIKFHLYVLGIFMFNLLESKQIERVYYIPSYSGDNEKPRNVLTVEEIKTLYEHCQSDLQRAILSVAYGCGLRRSEIEALDVRDVQFSSKMLIVRDGKGSKRREVPMSNLVIEHLKKYVIEERYQKLVGKSQIEEAFFIYDNSKRMTGEYLGKSLKKIIEQTENYELIKKDITLHCLRHSIAHHLSENNAGFEFIRRFLGHSEINTTYLYARKNKMPVVTF